MKPIMIIENNNTPLVYEEFVTAANKRAFLLGGIFTEFDIKNRNERVYTANKFLPCLTELNERITKLGVYGEFDHPDVFDTSLQRASHLVKEAVFNQEANRIEGKIQLLSTYWGKEARALVEDGCPVFVSSRAAGVTENDGSVTLKKLFTYDIVADPGFGSAKMNSINESLNYSNNANFRTYEMSDESKINDLFNMNKNDLVTKEQLATYSDYLVKEIETIKKSVNEAIKQGSMEPKKLENLLEYYETLNNTNTQMVKYLDYLAETLQVVVSDNKNLREISEKLISHNDYLAGNLEKSINYQEEVAESVDRSIQYIEYVAGKLDETIDYTGYLKENLDKTIAYSEYIAEHLDQTIAYGEYLAETVDNSIAYVEYLAEHVEGNIAYSEYIAEHLDDNIAYGEYIAEHLDKAISYAGLISEKLNGNRINEDASSLIPTLEEWGFETSEEEVITDISDENTEENTETEQTTDINATIEPTTEPIEPIADVTLDNNVDSVVPEVEATIDNTIIEPTADVADIATTDITVEPSIEIPSAEDITSAVQDIQLEPAFFGESDTELSLQINNLISEATKRKKSETNDLHFLKFLNKSQVDSYYSLTNEEQELVKIHVNGKNYFDSKDVLKLMQEALSVKNETVENRVTRLMPDNIKPIWENLNDISKKSILSQARLYPDLTNESAIEHFWYTRNLKQDTSKKLVSHDALIQEDKLSDNEVTAILERIKGLK